MPSDDSEPSVIAPPFVQAMRALDHLWMASNALTHCNNKKADRMAQEIDELRKRFGYEVLPSIMKRETLG